MATPIRGTLQLDFDGTLAVGDVSTGILERFAGPEWSQRIDAASRELGPDPDSPALINAMTEGFAALSGDTEAYLRFAHAHHPVRPGLPELIEAATRSGLECHVVSNGFEFYIRDYLRVAGVEQRVEVHSGAMSSTGRIQYMGPEGSPVSGSFKPAWADHFLHRRELLVYAGDGASDVAAARLAGVVFARDSLLTSMPSDFKGTLLPFDTLYDVATGLPALLDRFLRGSM